MNELKRILLSHRKIILLKNREILRKFRKLIKDWEEYIVILGEEREIIIPQRLLNRKIVGKLRDKYLIIDRETTSKFREGKKITVHFWRIRLTESLIGVIKHNPNLIDIDAIIEKEVKKRCFEECKELIEEIMILRKREEMLDKYLKELEEKMVEEENKVCAKALGIPKEYIDLIEKPLIYKVLAIESTLQDDFSKIEEVIRVREIYGKIIEDIRSAKIKLILKRMEKEEKIREYIRKVKKNYYKIFNIE